MNTINWVSASLLMFCFFSCSTTGSTIVKQEKPFSAVALVKTVGNIDVMVDPNVELMNIIQHLSGLPPRVSAKDYPYLAKVDEHFAPYQYSAAVWELRNSGMFYGLAAQFGMYLNSDDSDFIMKPDSRFFVVHEGPANKVPYYCFPSLREAVREFRMESHFDQFFLSNTIEYEALIAKHVQILKTANFDSWLEDFYGIKQREKVCLYLTKGTWNYGISFATPTGGMIPHAVVMDHESAEDTLYLISHEFSHPVTHEIIDELYEDTSIRRIFDNQYIKNVTSYRSHGYGSGYSVLGETFNQACANKFNETLFSENTMQRYFDFDVEFMKMEYVQVLTKFLDNYQNNRNQYRTLKDFVPELKKFLVTLE